MSVFDTFFTPLVVPDRDPSPPDPGPVPEDEQCSEYHCHQYAEKRCEECGFLFCDDHFVVVLDERVCRKCSVKITEAA